MTRHNPVNSTNTPLTNTNVTPAFAPQIFALQNKNFTTAQNHENHHNLRPVELVTTREEPNPYFILGRIIGNFFRKPLEAVGLVAERKNAQDLKKEEIQQLNQISSSPTTPKKIFIHNWRRNFHSAIEVDSNVEKLVKTSEHSLNLIELDPDNSAHHENLAQSLSQIFFLKESTRSQSRKNQNTERQNFAKIVSRFPKDRIDYDHLNRSTVTHYLDSAIAKNPNSASLFFTKGLLNLFTGNPRKEIFARAKELDQTKPWISHFMGIVNHPFHSQQTLDYFHEEMKINPNPQTKEQMAIFVELEADKQKNTARKQKDAHQKSITEKAATQHYEEALVSLLSVSKESPEMPSVNLRIAHIHNKLNKPELAEIYFNKELAIAKDSNNYKMKHHVLQEMGLFYLKEKKFEHAVHAFKESSADKENFPLFHETFPRYFNLVNAQTFLDKNPNQHDRKLHDILKMPFASKEIINACHYGAFRKLAQFRLKHFGFDEAQQQIEQSFKDSPQDSLMLKAELAALKFEHFKSIKSLDNKRQNISLLDQVEELLSSESDNISFNNIKKEMNGEISHAKKRLAPPPNTTTKTTSVSKADNSREASQSHTSSL